jgi:hypothetical protein
MYMDTALAPSEMACFPSSPGSTSRTALCTSREVSVIRPVTLVRRSNMSAITMSSTCMASHPRSLRLRMVLILPVPPLLLAAGVFLLRHRRVLLVGFLRLVALQRHGGRFLFGRRRRRPRLHLIIFFGCCRCSASAAASLLGLLLHVHIGSARRPASLNFGKNGNHATRPHSSIRATRPGCGARGDPMDGEGTQKASLARVDDVACACIGFASVGPGIASAPRLREIYDVSLRFRFDFRHAQGINKAGQ